MKNFILVSFIGLFLAGCTGTGFKSCVGVSAKEYVDDNTSASVSYSLCKKH